MNRAEKTLNLLDNWHKIIKSFDDAKLLVILDYDGTLVPLRDDGNAAAEAERAAQVLQGLTGFRHASICVVSGRDLEELRKLTGYNRRLICAGSQGLEFKHMSKRYFMSTKLFEGPVYEQIFTVLSALAARNKVPVSRRKFSLFFNLLGLPREKAEKFCASASRACAKYEKEKLITFQRTTRGLEAFTSFEVGRAAVVFFVQRLELARSGRRRLIPLYIGDGVEDEQVFPLLRAQGGLTVHVGQGRTAAQYCLRDQSEVFKLLDKVRAYCEASAAKTEQELVSVK